MSGALLQLAALSSQDVYLTGNPEITLFKKNYLRYTYFAVETVQSSFDGGAVNFGITSTASLEKSGDLISKMVLVLKLKQLTTDVKWGYVDKIGHAIIDYVSITVDNTEVDRRYNDWIDIYQSITRDKSQQDNYNTMIGNVASLKKFSLSHDGYTLYIPLEFWTGKLTSSAFPICCTNNVKSFQVSIVLRNAIDCINYFGSTEPSELPEIENGYLLVDYIYLENEEQQLFKNNSHKYLIEVVDRMDNTISTLTKETNLTFVKATKYLVWYAQLERFVNRSTFLSWATDDNWEVARNEFAKLVWLATRAGLDATTDPTQPKIIFDGGALNIGEELPMVVGGNTLLQTLAGKVSAIILFATTNEDDLVEASATIDNVVLTSNTITFEDMTNTINEIKAAPSPVPIPTPDPRIQQNAFMDLHTNSIIDIFNYGNFINRSDNPVISSSFQLNGNNRFQERDGYFYNYLQPYYYFKNSPADGINIYTFSLNPEDIQPSGLINLGKITSGKTLKITLGKYNNKYNNYISYFGNGVLRIFALAYISLNIQNAVAFTTNE